MVFASNPLAPAQFSTTEMPSRSIWSSLPLRHVFLLLIFPFLFDVSLALKCKCTQNSPKVVCDHGTCEVSSAASACLMLDHPHSGRHYACSTSELKEGECVEKRSRSGANVKVCSCNSSDFCNFKIWPDGNEQQFDEDNDEGDESDGEETAEDSEEGENSNKKEGPIIVERESLTNGATTKTRKEFRMPVTILNTLLILLFPTIFAVFSKNFLF